MSNEELNEMGQKGKTWLAQNLSYPILLDRYESSIKISQI